jgi:myo-inositol-1(or 4)-monophosphatase
MKSLMIKAAKDAGKVILENYENIGKLKFKSPRSIVTKVDILSEKAIVDRIKKEYPLHNILAEEKSSRNNGSRFTWIIDPIDGTTNFVSKIRDFAVSIALAEDDEIMMGIVYNPVTRDMYFAEKYNGAFKNGVKLHVSKKTKFDESILAYSLPSDIKISRKALSIISKTFGTFRGVRNNGSAALTICYIADRQFDIYFTLHIKPWDAAAAKLVLEEAGGKATNLKGKMWQPGDDNIVATNGALHNRFIKLLR